MGVVWWILSVAAVALAVALFVRARRASRELVEAVAAELDEREAEHSEVHEQTDEKLEEVHEWQNAVEARLLELERERRLAGLPAEWQGSRRGA